MDSIKERLPLRLTKRHDVFTCKEFLIFTTGGKVHKVPNNGYTNLASLLTKVDFDAKEHPFFVTSTSNYKGFMLFGFENGKIAKVPLTSYQTKTQRKELKNAFYTGKKLVYIDHLEEDEDLIAVSSIQKVVLFSTSLINPKETATTIGVQVLTAKDNSKMTQVINPDKVAFGDLEYYRKLIPAIGNYLLKEDSLTIPREGSNNEEE